MTGPGLSSQGKFTVTIRAATAFDVATEFAGRRLFSLQAILGKRDKRFGQLEASAAASHERTPVLAMAAGTAVGGWRIIKAFGQRMVRPHPINGVAAATRSAAILSVAADFGMPVSTAHGLSTAIRGVGFARNPKALKCPLIVRNSLAWMLGIPAAGAIACGLVRLLMHFDRAWLFRAGAALRDYSRSPPADSSRSSVSPRPPISRIRRSISAALRVS